MIKKNKKIELSVIQKGIYFDCQLEDPSAYNVSATVELNNITEKYFEMALQLVVTEQEVLRSRLEVVNNFPVLSIQEKYELKLEKMDLSNEKINQQEKISMLIKQEISSAFDLDQYPLYRAKLIKLKNEKYVFIFCIHHIIADGVSFNILLKKLLTYHNQLQSGLPIPLKIDTGFIQYIQKENARLASGKYQQQKEFWLEKLKDIKPVHFPVDYITQNKGAVGREKSFNIKQDLANAIHSLSSDLEVTEYMFFLAIFTIILCKYTADNEVVVCSPIFYRPDFELQETFGCFINMLFLRIHVEKHETFSSLLKKVSKELINTYKNIEYPSNLVVQEVAANSSALFDILFVQDIYEETREEDLTAKIISQEWVTFPGSMMFVHNKTTEGDYLKIQYKEEVFQEQTIELLGQHFLYLLELSISNIHIEISSIELLLKDNMLTNPNKHSHPPILNDVSLAQSSTENLESCKTHSHQQTNLIEEIITTVWEEVLSIEGIKPDDNFFDIGGHSLSLIEVNNKLKSKNLILSIRTQFQYPTIRSLAKYFAKDSDRLPLQKNTILTNESQARNNEIFTRQDIAIIGLSVDVPGAKTLYDFWDNLKNQKETIHYYSDEELIELGVPLETIKSPNYVKAVGRVDGVDYFDPTFFDFAPADIYLMSPQYRLLYPGIWRAFEDAGYYPNSDDSTIALYLSGSDDFDWYQDAIINQQDYGRKYQAFTLSTNHFLATHLAYKLDLKGPVFTALSGCSSALLTVHLACQGLALKECDLAIAGGITYELPNRGGYFYEPGMMFSPDGHCRPFDAKAAGTFFSSGMGLVVLKRLDDALRAGDNIYAVIKGSAVNNDGAYKLSFTAPSVDGQADAIRKAYKVAGIHPETISYVEAHGTGTSLGDPIEVESLIQAFSTEKKQYCTLSSVKGNIGHTDTAAGAVSLVKVALSMKNKFIPGTVNFEVPNPKIDFSNSPFVISATGVEWIAQDAETLRRAGINSFGVGGTNVHMVLEEPSAKQKNHDALTANLLIFSAKTASALNNTAKNIVQYLRKAPNINLSAAAWTLQVGRKEFPFRKFVVIESDFYDQSEEEILNNLDEAAPYEVKEFDQQVCFMFSGQGSQYQGMARDLYNSKDHFGISFLFKQHLDAVLECIPAIEKHRYLDVIFGDEAADRINQTEFSQFALFAIGFALAITLIDLGIKPNVMLGHSIGEVVAATIAGVFTLKDAVEIVVQRGRIMQKQPIGVMLAVIADANVISQQLIAGVWLALENTTDSCVVGGTEQSITEFESHCKEKGYATVRLKTSHAFHTPMMKAAAEEFYQKLKNYRLNIPAIPILSNTSGTWARNEDIINVEYWAKHILQPVKFSSCLAQVLSKPNTLFIEIGPGQVLSSFAKKHADCQPTQQFINLIRHKNDTTHDVNYLNRKIGELWCAGLTIDWMVLKGSAYLQRISLPTYAFDQDYFPIPVYLTAAEKDENNIIKKSIHKDLINSPKAISIEIANSLEDIIIDAYKVVLGYKSIKANQDFFGLGGDSLKAIGIVSEIKTKLGVNIDVKDIFTQPTPSSLANFIKPSLSLQQQSMPIVPIAIRRDYPLSSAQRRMFTLHMLDKNSLAYNLPSATIIEGELDYECFKQTLQKLIMRHEPLRTAIEIQNSIPVQVITTDCMVPILFSETNIINDDEIKNLIQNFIKPFELDKSPLFRAELIKLSKHKHLFLFDIHHIIADGTSMEVISKDFNQLYVGELSPVLIQYKDFSVWQANFFKTELFKKQKNFWLDYLSGELPVLELPTDYDRPMVKQSKGDRIYFSIDQNLTKKLTAFSQTSSTTLFMLFLAAWNVLLARYSDQEDIIVGVPVAGRTQKEITETVGMFVNILPIRNTPNNKLSFFDFLLKVKDNVLNAFNNQDYQFDELVKDLNITRDLSRNAIFDVCFDFQNMQFHELQVANLQFSQYQFATNSAPYDLVLTCQENKKDGRIEAFVDFSTALFKKETIARIIANYQIILETVIKEKEILLEDINIISIEEENAYTKFNATNLIIKDDHSINQWFEGNANVFSNQIALIVSNGKQFTYAELNEKANSIAHALIASGTKKNKVVGILTDRTEYLFFAMLGVLKAGSAFLLIDPSLPKERINYLLENCTSNILLYTTKFLDKYKFPDKAIDLSSHNYTKNIKNPNLNNKIIDLAYLVFTSGSTGKPKGVLINQTAVINFIHDIKNRNIFTQSADRIIALTNVAFDIFIFESIIPLCLGYSIYLASETEQLDPVLANQKIIQYKITHILGTISRIKSFADNVEFKHALQQLKCILSGGESFPLKLLKDLQAQSKAKIYNMYGPTETTIWSTTKDLTHSDSINIGSPITNTQIYIINNAGRLQPIGVFGELCIAGTGLAAGYLNNSAETKNRFMEIANEIMVYRTGDRARLNAIGELELKGRLDTQVKVRGYRIELNEIEKVVLENEAINLAAVLIFDDKSNNKQLALYYTVKENSKDHYYESELRNWLKAKLPSYMLPAYINRLNEMPLLPSGKINRNALPLPNTITTLGKDDFIKQSTTNRIEQTLLTLWQEVLSVQEISVHDNFFDLGGNSLGLIAINNKLSEILQSSIPLLKFFEYPTIAEFANSLLLNEDQGQEKRKLPSVEQKCSDIAVIGIAGKFPGADNINQFWENIANGIESITEFDKNTLLDSGIDNNLIANPNYIRSKGYLQNTEYFDSEFFGYTHNEAEMMDPQARMLHQCAWEVLENAGYDPFEFGGMIGLYAGSGTNILWTANLIKEHQDVLNVFEAITFNEKDFLTTRLSYKLNLKGPSYNIQTACSTSLVAIHEAVQSLINNECEMAIAGGVSISYPRKEGYLWHEGLIFSKDGHCRPFAKDASGIIPGNGCGLVLLKSLESALKDGDHIYAVIKASAVNNDGIDKVGYTAPSINGQRTVIEKALEKSGLAAEQINYVEAHGTGTSLGDPIEISALKNAWQTERKNFCAIGSVKANIGHLDSAAGVAGLIKALLTLYNRTIPPLVNFKSSNPMIDFENSPFYINTKAININDKNQILRAAVSSFGIGGTNAHLILEQAPLNENTNDQDVINILPFSAKKSSVLMDTSKKVLAYLQDNTQLNLSDAAWTLQVGRRAFNYRKVLVTSGPSISQNLTNSPAFLQNPGIIISDKKKKIIYLFSGEDVLSQAVSCQLYQLADRSELSYLYKKYMDETLCYLLEEDRKLIRSRLLAGDIENESEKTSLKMLLLFLTHYCLARVFIDLGLFPDSMLGQGIGEVVALTLAGVLEINDAISLVKNEFNLIFGLKPAAMTDYLANKVSLLEDANVLNGMFKKYNHTTQSVITLLGIAEHINFSKNIESLLTEEALLVEVSTSQLLIKYLENNYIDKSHHKIISLLYPTKDGTSTLVHLNKMLGEIWCHGIDIDWKKLNNNIARKRMPLPSYQFVQEYHNCDIIQASSSGSSLSILENENNEYTASKIAETLSAIWCEQFGYQDVKQEDDFFKLGGDSLKAIVLAAKIHKKFGIEISLSEIFNHSTFKKLLNWILTHLENKDFEKITPLELRSFYPTSYAQKRLYTVQQLLGDAIPYNLAAIYKVSGNLDKEKLKFVFDSLVKRHEAFRTRFLIQGDEIVQIIEDHVDSVIEFEFYSGNRIKNKIKDFIRPFNLAEAPLLRAKVIELGNNEFILIIDTHHIIVDQSSISILLREIQDLYSGKTLVPLSLQYKDFAVWQNELFKQDKIKSQLQYWQNEFSGTIPILEMPLDFSRKSARKLAGKKISFKINNELSCQIDKLASKYVLTPYMIFIATLKLLLGKYSGQNDLVLGTATAGRNNADVLNIVGMFVNTLAIRSQIDASLTLEKYLQYIKSKMLSAYDNQDCQFEMLLAVLNNRSDLARNPLFDIVINYIDMGQTELTLADLLIQPWEELAISTKFDMSWTIEKNLMGYKAEVEFSCDLYKRQTIQKLINHWLYILTNIVSKPNQKIFELSLLADNEKKYLAYDLNQTTTNYPKESTIIDLFNEQVTLNSQKVAVICNDKTLTYADLDKEVNKIVDMLIANKVQPGHKIAIMLEPCPLQVVCILAILRCAAVYVPIDPRFPAQRINFILNDSNTALLLTESSLINQIDHSLNIILVDENFTFLPGKMPAALNVTSNKPSANDLAYIMYTSGSTGTPKGVLVNHRNIIRLVKNTNYIEFLPGDHVLQLSNFTFDGSVFGIFGALLNGVSLVLIPDKMVIEISMLANLIKQNENVVFFITTALFNLLVDYDVSALKNVRKIFVGGESQSMKHIYKALQHLGPNKLNNVYGPTETSVFATYYPINTLTSDVDSIPIGYPLSNTKLYVLDENQQLLPPGISGELYIGGDGVAQGYLNNTELTKKYFLPNPFVGQGNMYKSGDRVKRLPTGEIVYIGRYDSQIKIRGFRVELGEIEVCVKKMAGVKDAIAIANKDNLGDSYIALYYTTHSTISEADVTQKKIRNFLVTQLPSYMIPAKIKKLDNLPLNVNGKIDVNQILLNDKDPSIEQNSQVQTSIDDAILICMREVLDLANLHSTDDFFECGGHSIKAIALSHRLLQMGLQINVSDIFQHPSANSLSEFYHLNNTHVEKNLTVNLKNEVDLITVNDKQINMIIDQLQCNSNRLSQLVASAETIFDFQMTGIQLLHQTLVTRYSGFYVKVESDLSKTEIRCSLAKIIKSNQMLHSLVNKKLKTVWTEYNISPIVKLLENNISYIDLSTYDDHSKQIIFDKVSKFIISSEYQPGNLPWRCCCLHYKANLNYIIWGFDHIVFDGMSADFLRKQIKNTLELGKPIHSNLEYQDYGSLLAKGPQRITEDEIIENFELNDWAKANILLDKLANSNLKKSNTINLIISIAEYSIIDPFSFTFELVINFIQRYFGIENVPLGLVHYGRSYIGLDYYDCIGEFIDIIPLLINRKKQSSNILDLLGKCRKHLINFTSIIFNKNLSIKYPELTGLLTKAFKVKQKKLNMILFNFQGYVDGEEIDRYQAAMKDNVNDQLSKFQIIANYDKNYVRISIAGKIDVENGNEIINKYLPGISNNVKIVNEESYV